MDLSRKNRSTLLNSEKNDKFFDVKLKCAGSVVAIEVTHPRNFGLVLANTSHATGFIVDETKGIILSNKHVVHSGPCRAKARFSSNEEIELIPIYRDPVHDFGFFKFDRESLSHTVIEEIELCPEDAYDGVDALLVGNNGGEKLSYVRTTIARVDRPATIPLDMNTFHITASDTSVGGSSGAPLLSREGKALAMMAAGSERTNISLYLPLDRVKVALKSYLETNSFPQRGTMQVVFLYISFDALLQRGVVTSEQVEAAKRHEECTGGMLVVSRVVPNGTGDKAGLQSGDILFKVNDIHMCNYTVLESTLDSNVDGAIAVDLIRQQEEYSTKVDVQNLAEIEVKKFVEVSNGIFHETQYKVAAALNIPIEGVFVAKSGYMFRDVPFASIIKKIGSSTIKNIDDFRTAIQKLNNAELVPVRYQPIQDKNRLEIAVVTVDKRWYPFQEANRMDDSNGIWKYTGIKTEQSSRKLSKFISKSKPSQDSTTESIWKHCFFLVDVKYSIPFSVDGGNEDGTTAMGIVVDKEYGLVLTSRDAVSTTLVDVQLVFNKSKTIAANVIYIDPETPITIIKYDPRAIANDGTVQVVEAKFSEDRPKIDEVLHFVGYNTTLEYTVEEAKVLAFRDVNIFGGELRGHQMGVAPNEYVSLNTGSTNQGIFLGKKCHRVKAYSLSSLDGKARARLAVDAGTIISHIRDCKGGIKGAIPKEVRLMPFTVRFLELAEARIHHLPLEWAVKLEKSMTPYQRKLLVVKRRMVETDACAKLHENDIILAVGGVPVTLIRKFYEKCRDQDRVQLTLLRGEEVIKREIRTHSFSTIGTSRILHFAGLILQDLYPAIYFLSSPQIIGDGGVYVTYEEAGSPASAAKLMYSANSPQHQIVGKIVINVNGTPVPTLENFIEKVKTLKNGSFVRLLARDLTSGAESVHHIRLDLDYWKTRYMVRDSSQGVWNSRIYSQRTMVG